MKVALTLHDFSIQNNRFDLLEKLKEYYPEFKVSLFTVPNDVKHLSRGNREEDLSRLKSHLDWMQLIPHGLTHRSSEMAKVSYKAFRDHVIPAIVDTFYKDGLPFVKGFCAPHWQWNEEVVDALNDMGWWGAVSPQRPDMDYPKTFFRHNYSIDEAFFWSGPEDLKLYGHINETSMNSLDKCFAYLLRLPHDVEWCYATDFLEKL
jgi:hypothetical protein